MDFRYIRNRIRDQLRRITPVYRLYQFYLIIKTELYLHPKHLEFQKRNSITSSLPVLQYLEFHLSAHCNLKCKGCSQFSPIANEWFASLAEHTSDMKRLSNIFSNIKTIRLIGGEPLLNPEIEDFIIVTRKYFPESNICIATNGTLLESMPQSFWDTCRICNIKINWTLYPPFISSYKHLLREFQKHRVIITLRKVNRFRSVLNLNGDSNPNKALRLCRSMYFCPFLRSGRIYLCSRPLVIGVYNSVFGTNIPEGEGIDIHDANINGWDVLISISKSTDTCKYCATRTSYFQWIDSEKKAEEWNASV